MSLPPALLVVAGLIVLAGGAELLVRGAARLAARAGIPTLVVGLTVVALGTSSPEVAVSTRASLAGSSGIALGNVVGSNVFNVLFILGLSALVAPLAVNRQLVRLDVPVMVAVSLLPLLLALDGALGRLDGVLLLGLGALYTGVLVWLGLRERKVGAAGAQAAEAGAPGGSWPADLLRVAAGLLLLVSGAHWLVAGATDVARTLGLGEVVIGLTLVAGGTSLPEVATSVVATLRGQRDLAVGNVVGSNIFNVLVVLGAAGLVAPDGMPVPRGVLTFDLPVMIAVTVLCLPIFLTGSSIHRWEGALFLLYYALYLTYLLLQATDHEAEELFGTVVLVVVPLTVLTAGVYWYRKGRGSSTRKGHGTSRAAPGARGSPPRGRGAG